MSPLQAEQAWAVSYTPEKILEMADGYDLDALKVLNEHLAKDDYVVLSKDTQGYPGDLVIDFPAGAAEPYPALVKLTKGCQR
jgi:hypothetical protein